ncbi:MAG TPA: preprotein translocase subunit SecE [Patescibacteria group bacterium]
MTRLLPFKYLSEVRSELSKVIWPKKGEVIKLTVLVILISAIIGGYVGGLDLAFTKLLTVVLTK